MLQSGHDSLQRVHIAVLSLFSVPKTFAGAAAVIQDNAVASWTRLGNDCDIVLLGDDPGVAAAAARHGVRHQPVIARNALGTPLLSAVLRQMDESARFPLVALVNADIVLLDDFLPAVLSVSRNNRNFMLVASRYNCRIDTPLRFENGWDAALRVQARAENQMYPAAGSDIFVFHRGLFGEVPELAIGRGYWDNWLMRDARRNHASLIDATACLTSVHQEHGYGHVPGVPAAADDESVYRGEEGRRNLALAGGHQGLYTMFDATHVLMTADGRLRSTWSLPLAHRRLKASVRRIVRGLIIRDDHPRPG
jgi:hypothetical protein